MSSKSHKRQLVSASSDPGKLPSDTSSTEHLVSTTSETKENFSQESSSPLPSPAGQLLSSSSETENTNPDSIIPSDSGQLLSSSPTENTNSDSIIPSDSGQLLSSSPTENTNSDSIIPSDSGQLLSSSPTENTNPDSIIPSDPALTVEKNGQLLSSSSSTTEKPTLPSLDHSTLHSHGNETQFLQWKVESLESLPKEYQQLYEKRPDGFFLRIKGGVIPKERLDEFRDNNIALKQKLEELQNPETPQPNTQKKEATQESSEKTPLPIKPELNQVNQLKKELAELRLEKQQRTYQEKLYSLAQESGLLPEAFSDLWARFKDSELFARQLLSSSPTENTNPDSFIPSDPGQLLSDTSTKEKPTLPSLDHSTSHSHGNETKFLTQKRQKLSNAVSHAEKTRGGELLSATSETENTSSESTMRRHTVSNEDILEWIQTLRFSAHHLFAPSTGGGLTSPETRYRPRDSVFYADPSQLLAG